jgi:hypothetical protein
MHGYLNQAWVLEALGVPVNYSASSHAVAKAFDGTSDFDRAGSSEAVSYLLDSGVKVHMVYGDRDYACGWIGGEAASLAIQYSGTEKFKNAGYAPILSSTGIGGFVRQYGNFSFSRVFQAGHEGELLSVFVLHLDSHGSLGPWYQPELYYKIFMRAMFNKDIATGIIPVFDQLATIGPSSTFHVKNKIPDRPEPRCYTLSPKTCTREQYASLLNGTAIVKDFFVVGNVENVSRSGAQQFIDIQGRPEL